MATAITRTLMQAHTNLYNATVSAPHTLTSATLTQALADIGSTPCTLWLTEGTWALTTDHTIPAHVRLWVPHGVQVNLAAGTTLTLGAAPLIDAPLWLSIGAGARVNITAPGYRIPLHLFATGGAGTQTSPWIGWELVFDYGIMERNYYAPAGWYQFATTVQFSQERVTFLGDGKNTIFNFVPTVHDLDAFTVGRLGAETFYYQVGNFQVTSSDTTYRKTAVHLIDISASVFHHLYIGDSTWHDTSNNSIGFHFEGRDTSEVGECIFSGDYPMVLDGSPNSRIDALNKHCDMMTWRNLMLIGHPGVQHACLTIKPEAFLSNNNFCGFLSLNRGNFGILWSRSQAAGVSYSSQQNRFENVRWEQEVASTPMGWGFYMDHTEHPAQNLRISTFECGALANGIFLRSVQNVHLDGFSFVSGGSGQTGLDVDGVLSDGSGHFTGVYPVICTGCRIQPGAAFTYATEGVITAQAPRSYYAQTGPLPSTSWFIIDHPSGGAAYSSTPTPFTPLLQGSTSTGSNTYTSRVGYYQVSGQVGTFEARLVVNSWDAVGTVGNIAVGGLPIAASIVSGLVGSITVGDMSGVTLSSGYSQFTATISPGNNGATLWQIGNNVGVTGVPASAIHAGSVISVAGFFYVQPP